MRRNTPSAAPAQAGSAATPNNDGLRDAFLTALRERAPRGGQVVLPVGLVDAAEAGHIAAVIARLRADGGDR
jgi:hypothetical protein